MQEGIYVVCQETRKSYNEIVNSVNSILATMKTLQIDTSKIADEVTANDDISSIIDKILEILSTIDPYEHFKYDERLK